MEDQIAPLKKTARRAGLLYLGLLLTAPYAHFYVPSKIFIRNDAIATTQNMLNYEWLFRTCVVATLLEAVIFLLLGLQLYRLFSNVNRSLARLMIAFVAVQLPVVFILAALKITALMVANGATAIPFTPEELPAFSMLLLKGNEYGMKVLQLLWGLWLLPLGLLAYRSRFVPRMLGVLLAGAAAGYAFSSLAFLLWPAYESQIQVPALALAATGEIPIMIWLLVKGVREHISISVVSETNKRNVGIPSPTS